MKKIVILVITLMLLTACTEKNSVELDEDELCLSLTNTQINEIDLYDVFSVVNGINITRFDVSINQSGFINKMNLSYVDTDETVEKTIVYRREEETIKSYEIDNEGGILSAKNGIEVLRTFGDNIVDYENILNVDEILIYELLSPSPISIEANIGDIVDGKEINEMQDIKGIVYHVYCAPIKQEGYKKMIIETDKH